LHSILLCLAHLQESTPRFRRNRLEIRSGPTVQRTLLRQTLQVRLLLVITTLVRSVWVLWLHYRRLRSCWYSLLDGAGCRHHMVFWWLTTVWISFRRFVRLWLTLQSRRFLVFFPPLVCFNLVITWLLLHTGALLRLVMRFTAFLVFYTRYSFTAFTVTWQALLVC